jgi:hypothetical protein
MKKQRRYFQQQKEVSKIKVDISNRLSLTYLMIYCHLPHPSILTAHPRLAKQNKILLTITSTLRQSST